MINRFNRTGRAGIDRAHAQIELVRAASGKSFHTLHMEVQRYGFPSDAVLQLEAWRSNTSQRWDYGTVGDPRVLSEQERTLTSVPGSARFKLKVVAGDRSGRLLGATKPLSPVQPRQSLIPVDPVELDGEVWRLSFEDDGQPALQVNKKIAGISETIRTDAQFRSLVMPQILRSVLTQIYFVEELGPDGDDESWADGWFRLAKSLDGTVPEKIHNDSDRAGVLEWVDRVVAMFSSEKVDAYNAYVRALES